jgi:hypothetical protein
MRLNGVEPSRPVRDTRPSIGVGGDLRSIQRSQVFLRCAEVTQVSDLEVRKKVRSFRAVG